MRVGVCEGSFKEGYILRTFGLEREKLSYPKMYEWLGGIDIYFDSEEDWRRVRQELGFYVYSDDKKEMEEVVGELLKERGLKLAVAESCTGGLLSARLVNVPGSSQYFLGGFVVYSNELKKKAFERRKGALTRARCGF
jgi:nicotinamide-nucleotide amidase